MTVLAVRGFYLFGGILAAYAVVLSFIGLTNARFPGNLGGQRVVVAVSTVLVVLAIGVAIVTSKTEETHQPGITKPGKQHG